MIEDLIQEVKASMDKSVESYQKDIKRIRTGRASLALLDGIMVDYYGSSTPINQLATLSIPEARQIVIQPWDSQAVPDIEKAIHKSELGLTPSNDGKLIRIVLPPLTAERRKELVKLVKKDERGVQGSSAESPPRCERDAQRAEKGQRRSPKTTCTKVRSEFRKTRMNYIAKLDKVHDRKRSRDYGNLKSARLSVLFCSPFANQIAGDRLFFPMGEL